MTRWAGRASTALLGLALAALSFSAKAAELRPYDAPRVGVEHPLPAIPPEYHSQEEAGVVLSYHPSTRERVRPITGRVAAIRAELSAELGLPVLSHVKIRVAAAPSEMARLAPVEQVPSYAPAVAFSEAKVVVICAASPFSSDPPDLETWLRHGLAHIAFDEALGGHQVPRWLHEGYAIRFAGEDAMLRAEVLSVALLRGRIVDLASLETRFPAEPQQGSVAAAEAADLARFLAERPNHRRFAEMLAKMRTGEPFEAAVTAAYGEGLGGVEARWRQAMARRYSFIPAFVVATLLWVLVAAAVMLRRARRRRALAGLQRHRGVDTARRITLSGRKAHGGGFAGVTLGRRGRITRVLDDDVLHGEPIPPDPEVPKVEHDGRWYTLH